MTKVKPASGISEPARRVTGPQGASNALTKAAKGISGANFSNPGMGGPIAPPLPWDSVAEGQVANAGSQYKATSEQIAANKDIGLREFGLDPGYNDWKNNPYSQAAILQHNHEGNEAGIKVTAGQALYSGQTGNAQGIEAGRRNRGFNDLSNAEARQKAQWVREEQDAATALKEAKNEAQGGAIDRALKAEPEDVPLPGGSNGGQQKEKIPYPPPPNKKWAWNGSHWHLVKA
jgi:hypothetical protein